MMFTPININHLIENARLTPQERRARRRLAYRLIDLGYQRLRSKPGGQPIDVMDGLARARLHLRNVVKKGGV